MDSDLSAAKPRRDSAATRGRLLAAATDEFAARGIAGARVDRIASAARANKRLIYDYFTDKDGLFDAVMDATIGQVTDAVPIDATDLPGYAGRLFDYVLDHPEVMRLVAWARLEGRHGPTARGKSAHFYRLRLAAIEAAQQDGHITTRLTPAQILMLIESLSVGWLETTPVFLAASDHDAAEHHHPQPLPGNAESLNRARAVIIDSVRRLIT